MKRWALFFVLAALALSTCLGPSMAMAQEDNEIIFTTSQADEPKSLNMNWSFDGGANNPCNSIFSRLVSFDIGMEVYPDLAETWETSTDGTTHTFHLRKNVKWHDGQPFTASDVKYTFETVIENNYPAASLFKGLAGISCPDEHTVVVKFSKANVTFVPMLAFTSMQYLVILPKHIYEGKDWSDCPENSSPVGTGPFKLGEWSKGNYVSLVANDDYFLGRPKVDKVVIRIIPDASVAQQAFKAGQLDHLNYEIIPSFAELAQWMEDPRYNVVGGLWCYDRNISFNVTKAPFDNPKVREAFAKLIDRDHINKLAFNDMFVPNDMAGIPAVEQWLNREARFPAYDLDGALKLLDDAGYPLKADGTRMNLIWINAPMAPDRLITEVLIQDLAEVGIKIKWNEYDWNTWYEKYGNGEYDICADYVRYVPDPDSYRDLFSTTGSRNFKGYSNPEVDRLLELGASEPDQAKRKAYYDEVQEILVKDMPYVSITNVKQFEVLKAGWSGVPMDAASANKAMSWFGYYAVEYDPAAGSASGAERGSGWLWWVLGIALAIGAAVVLTRRKK